MVLEELGRVVAPGPFLPTVLASAVIAEAGSDEQRRDLLPGLVDGSVVAGVGLLSAQDGGSVTDDLVLGGGLADLVLLVAGDDVLVVRRRAVQVTVPDGLDHTRRSARVTAPVDAARTRLIGAAAAAHRLARVLAGAEAAGIATACLEMALAYAKERDAVRPHHRHVPGRQAPRRRTCCSTPSWPPPPRGTPPARRWPTRAPSWPRRSRRCGPCRPRSATPS